LRGGRSPIACPERTLSEVEGEVEGWQSPLDYRSRIEILSAGLSEDEDRESLFRNAYSPGRIIITVLSIAISQFLTID
jgi:hypothetical protein